MYRVPVGVLNGWCTFFQKTLQRRVLVEVSTPVPGCEVRIVCGDTKVPKRVQNGQKSSRSDKKLDSGLCGEQARTNKNKKRQQILSFS